MVVKPDNGVGASNTFRLKCDDDLRRFIEHKDDNIDIMEEFVNGHVETFDAIIDSNGKAIFESGNVTPHSLMDVVNNNEEALYYIVKELAPDIRDAGIKTVEAFGVKSRFVHLEFFVLNEDQEGLGKQGDVIGLEVNMRPAGGFTPDMYNFAYEINVYKLWADMIAFDHGTMPMDRPHHFCAFIGRRDGKAYAMDHNTVMEKYGANMKMQCRMPDAIADCMGNHMYLCNFDSEEEMHQYYRDLLAV